MRTINILFVILVVVVTTTLAKKAEIPKILPDGFKIDTLITNGEQVLRAPFAEVPYYSSNLGDYSIIGKFTVVEWNPTLRILKIETSEGERAVFSEREDFKDWYYVNYVDGVLRSETRLTWVGAKLANMIMRFSEFSEAEVSIIKNRIVITGDDSTFLWEEKIPEGVNCRVIKDKWLLISLPSGNLSDSSPLGRIEGQYIALKPNVIPGDNGGAILPNWTYFIEDMNSGFSGPIAENFGRFLK